jgi:hypothetical protein
MTLKQFKMADTEYDALLGDLRALTAAPNGAEFTRSNLIALLYVLDIHLSAPLATKEGELEDEVFRIDSISKLKDPVERM